MQAGLHRRKIINLIVTFCRCFAAMQILYLRRERAVNGLDDNNSVVFRKLFGENHHSGLASQMVTFNQC